MSTVVLTLVVVAGSIAVSAKIATSGELKPATDAPGPHRAPPGSGARSFPVLRRLRQARSGPATIVDRSGAELVRPRPGPFRRLAAGVMLVTITVVLGAAVALGLLGAAAVIGRALESAVQ